MIFIFFLRTSKYPQGVCPPAGSCGYTHQTGLRNVVLRRANNNRLYSLVDSVVVCSFVRLICSQGSTGKPVRTADCLHRHTHSLSAPEAFPSGLQVGTENKETPTAQTQLACYFCSNVLQIPHTFKYHPQGSNYQTQSVITNHQKYTNLTQIIFLAIVHLFIT